MFKKLLTLAAVAAMAMTASAEITWVELAVNGDAEGEYGDVPCAYGKSNIGETANQVTPAVIEAEADGNHVFAVHAGAKTDQAWDNQFWIMAPEPFKKFDTFKVSFRYKASAPSKASTQAHKDAGAYLYWQCIGEINFTTEWKEFSEEVAVEGEKVGMQSIAFNLSENAEACDYYFDDIKIELMVDSEAQELPETCLWYGEKACNWGDGVFLPASDFANIKVGDKLKFWTSDQSFQVLLGGWGGLNFPAYESHPNATYADGVLTITMIDEYAEDNEYQQGDEVKTLNVFSLIKQYGLGMHGTTTITRIDYIPADGEAVEEPVTSEYTVWSEGKDCNWGDGVFLPASLFADIQVGDQIKFWAASEGFQVLLGGWSGLNLPAYAAGQIDNATWDGTVMTITMIDEYTEDNEYEQGDDVVTLNVFELIKANGVGMHGPTTLTRIDYIPVGDTSAITNIAIESAPACYYNLSGMKVNTPAAGNIYIRVANGKATKVLVK